MSKYTKVINKFNKKVFAIFRFSDIQTNIGCHANIKLLMRTEQNPQNPQITKSTMSISGDTNHLITVSTRITGCKIRDKLS